MLKPIRWKTFPRDFVVIQIGFALFGISIALMIRSHLGTTPWAVLEVAFSQLTGITPGRMSIIVGFTVLLGALALRERIGWGTLANILFIGLWEDFFLSLIPDMDGGAVPWGMLLAAIFLMGIATAVYIGVDAGAGPRDSLMLALHRVTGLSLRVARGSIEIAVLSLRVARGSIEIAVCIIGGLLGGPLWFGTGIFALFIGPAVQWSFRVFKVQAHKPVQESTPL